MTELRRAAERTVRIQLDLSGAAGRFVHGGGEWLLDRVEKPLRVG